ncbi:MAG: T9SS type A sorting domain-containing protein [Flavobacterium sp.]|nr:T9SS type A sorting domain-containing protein [Flavobacterium sp.]
MKKAIVLFLIFISFVVGHAQNTVLSSGTSSESVGGSVSYSVGQLVFTSNTGTNGSVAQGVQQPIEISVELGLPEVSGINLTRVYPNPTSNYIHLKIEKYELVNLSFSVFDINGRVLSNGSILDSITLISLEKFPTATYYLSVLKGNKNIKTFKIIKR